MQLLPHILTVFALTTATVSAIVQFPPEWADPNADETFNQVAAAIQFINTNIQRLENKFGMRGDFVSIEADIAKVVEKGGKIDHQIHFFVDILHNQGRFASLPRSLREHAMAMIGQSQDEVDELAEKAQRIQRLVQKKMDKAFRRD